MKRGPGIKKFALTSYVVALTVWIPLINYQTFAGWREGGLFQDKQLEFIDFVYFYAAALLAKNSPPMNANPYDPVSFTAWVAQAMAPAHLSGNFAFQYPPYCLLVFRPLAELSMSCAWAAWSVLGVLAVIAASWLASAGSRSGAMGRASFSVGALASFPVWACIRIGQTSLLETFAVGMTLFLLRARPLSAGISSGLCMLKALFGLPVIIAGIAAGRARYLSGLAIAFAILGVASLYEVSLNTLMSFVGSILNTEAHSRVYAHLVPERMQNLRGALVLATGDDGPIVAVVVYLVWLLAMTGLAFAWFRLFGRGPVEANRRAGLFELLSGISVLAALVFSPHCYGYDYSLLAIICPLMWIWTENSESPNTRMALRILIILMPVLTWIHAFGLSMFQTFRIQFLFLCGLLLLALAVCELAPALKREAR